MWFFYTNINWASAPKKTSCLYWQCLVKKKKKAVHASAHAVIVTQRSCHFLEEAELLSKSERPREKQGKEGVARTYYFGFIAKQKFGWLGRLDLFLFFIS